MSRSSNASELRSLVAKLTGPTDPQLSCEECFSELDRYVEVELAGADAPTAVPGMRAHLQGCPACNEDYLSLSALLRSQGRRPS